MGRFRALHSLARTDNAGADQRRAGRVLVDGILNSEGRIFDLSATGARFRTNRRWRQGERKRMSLSASGVAMALEARCVWVRKVGFRRHLVGVEFCDLDDRKQAILAELARSNAARPWSAGGGGWECLPGHGIERGAA